MPTFRTSHHVVYKAADMFDLVADVENYPQFLPLCQGLIVRRRSDLADGKVLIIADMTMAYKIFRETISSRVTLDRQGLCITVEYLDGPFSHMENRWTFADDPKGGSTVTFYIDYGFRSRTLAMIVGAVFDRAFRRFSAAFEERAKQIYGQRSLPA